MFTILLSGLRPDSEILFTKNQGYINFFITQLDLKFVQQIFVSNVQKFQDMIHQKFKHHT